MNTAVYSVQQKDLKTQSVSLLVFFNYTGVTHTTMSSAIQALTQVKARISIMTVNTKKEVMGTDPTTMHNLSDYHVKSASSVHTISLN